MCDKHVVIKEATEFDEPETEERPWRRGLIVEHQRKTLFTIDLDVDIDNLPRLKPHVVLSRRQLEANEDE